MQFVFDERFAEAFLHRPKPHVVLGMRLVPFSYWHKVQLEWINSKVLLGGATLWDIYLAARICRTHYPRVAKVSGFSRWWQLLWNAFYGWRNPSRALQALHAYIDEYNSPPEYWGSKPSGKQRLAEAYAALHQLDHDPETLAKAQAMHQAAAAEKHSSRKLDDSLEQVSFYIKNASCPPALAWSMAIGELCWYNAAFQVFEGSANEIWTPIDEIHFQAHLEKRKATLATLTEELLKETPSLGVDMARALAAVKYWERVVRNIAADEKKKAG